MCTFDRGGLGASRRRARRATVLVAGPVLVLAVACSSANGPAAGPSGSTAGLASTSAPAAGSSSTSGAPAAPGGTPAARASIAREAVERDGGVVHRVIADGTSTTVVVHAEAPATASTGPAALVEIIDVDPGGTIRSREQVRQAVPATVPTNGRTMFDGAGDPAAASDVTANVTAVHRLYREVFNGRDAAVVDELVAADYAQHNPAVPDGSAGLKALTANGLPVTVKRVIGQGDLVAALVEYGTVPAVDIFRLADGKIVEHWDVLQLAPPAR
jgi:predicted SnoaL-like aldol condensation-catalyzing enzyme